MHTFLYRLGEFAFRRRHIVVAIWLAVLAAVVAGFLLIGGELDNEFAIPGSQSQQAQDLMARDFPAAAGTSAQIVFTAPDGTPVTDSRYINAIQQTLATAKATPQVGGVVDPFQVGAVSADQQTALAQIQYAVERSELDETALDALEAAVAPAVAAGLHVDVGGTAYGSDGVSMSALELLGVLVALLVLVVTFGSLLAAGMPLLSALAGVGVGVGGLFALTDLAGISSTAITLTLMLGLAVGIDYALFVLSRHRSQLAQGIPPKESAARANATAGGAVVFAGATVIIALVGLAVVRIPFLTVMGLSAAATVLIAVLVAITLLPALLGFAGHWMAPKPGSRAARRAAGDAAADESVATAGQRWAALVTRKPLLTLLAVVALLGVAAVPAAQLQLALPDNGSAAAASTQRRAYETISEAFGPGYNGPLVIYVDNTTAATAAQITGELQKMSGVAVVSPPRYNAETGSAVIQLVPDSAPDDEATKELVDLIRAQAAGIKDQTGADVSVTGTTAVNIDVSDRLNASLIPFLAIVVGLCLVLLLIVFRSLVVPIKAAAGFLLSAAASLGAVVAVFQWGWFAEVFGVARTGPVVSFLPVILIAVLFGLAMDYEVFLVSSMREEWTRTRSATLAIHRGARHASRVVTAAALIMFSVFASFATTEDALIKPIAFALAFGILVDAFVIRMTFVPAVLALVGAKAWWLPAWLVRILPNLDIEGHEIEGVKASRELVPAATTN